MSEGRGPAFEGQDGWGLPPGDSLILLVFADKSLPGSPDGSPLPPASPRLTISAFSWGSPPASILWELGGDALLSNPQLPAQVITAPPMKRCFDSTATTSRPPWGPAWFPDLGSGTPLDDTSGELPTGWANKPPLSTSLSQLSAPRDAWNSLGKMSREEAMFAYITEMKVVAQKVGIGCGLLSVPKFPARCPAPHPSIVAPHYISCMLTPPWELPPSG